jgi:hypothetical protein
MAKRERRAIGPPEAVFGVSRERRCPRWRQEYPTIGNSVAAVGAVAK